MNTAILTSPNQWFVPYASLLQKQLPNSKLFFEHETIDEVFDVFFILSYHRIIEKKYLKHKHNIVIHASPLPQGKGWAPLFWQILEGKNKIPFSMFEANDGVDDGDIYMQKTLTLTGYELHDELRKLQADFTIQMCLDFIEHYEKYKIPKPQNGTESFYPKRGPKDSELDIEKSIKEQFNLFRIVDNENYPAFFELDGQRYILKIELEKMGGVTLIDFVDLSLKEKQMVLQWRNHDDIKQWMYTREDISLQNHLGFISSLTGLAYKQYMVVKKEEKYIGVIDFSNINIAAKESDFGLYANPFEKIAGAGSVLLEAGKKYAFDALKLHKLKLEFFEENSRAENLYKKYHFKKVGQREANGKKIICMELDKKNLKTI